MQGTAQEALAYALREAESPEAGAFVGGEAGWFAVFFVAVLIFVFVLLLVQEKPA